MLAAGRGAAYVGRVTTIAVIPARFASSRLPGKPLADIGGIPMVEHVRRRTLSSGAVDRVLVATDDERIADVIAGFGGEAILTGSAVSGTHRVAMAVAGLSADFVVNVQGDMPLLTPGHVATLVALLHEGAPIATLACPMDADPHQEQVVKVVTRTDGRALYFSRAAIPVRGPYRRHLGLYGFRADALARIVTLPPAGLEQSEDLEQLRWMEAGFDVVVGDVDAAYPGVDTPAQLAAVQLLYANLEGKRA